MTQCCPPHCHSEGIPELSARTHLPRRRGRRTWAACLQQELPKLSGQGVPKAKEQQPHPPPPLPEMERKPPTQEEGQLYLQKKKERKKQPLASHLGFGGPEAWSQRLKTDFQGNMAGPTALPGRPYNGHKGQTGIHLHTTNKGFVSQYVKNCDESVREGVPTTHERGTSVFTEYVMPGLCPHSDMPDGGQDEQRPDSSPPSLGDGRTTMLRDRSRDQGLRRALPSCSPTEGRILRREARGMG